MCSLKEEPHFPRKWYQQMCKLMTRNLFYTHTLKTAHIDWIYCKWVLWKGSMAVFTVIGGEENFLLCKQAQRSCLCKTILEMESMYKREEETKPFHHIWIQNSSKTASLTTFYGIWYIPLFRIAVSHSLGVMFWFKRWSKHTIYRNLSEPDIIVSHERWHGGWLSFPSRDSI